MKEPSPIAFDIIPYLNGKIENWKNLFCQNRDYSITEHIMLTILPLTPQILILYGIINTTGQTGYLYSIGSLFFGAINLYWFFLAKDSFWHQFKKIKVRLFKRYAKKIDEQEQMLIALEEEIFSQKHIVQLMKYIHSIAEAEPDYIKHNLLALVPALQHSIMTKTGLSRIERLHITLDAVSNILKNKSYYLGNEAFYTQYGIEKEMSVGENNFKKYL